MGFKDFMGERLSFLDHYAKFVNRDKPLPSWSDADVEAFIATDPVHGPAVISFSLLSFVLLIHYCDQFWVFCLLLDLFI